MPEIVVLPANVEEAIAVIKVAKRVDVPTVPRGSGTALAKKDRLGLIRVTGSSMSPLENMVKIVLRLRWSTNNMFLLTGVSFAL